MSKLPSILALAVTTSLLLVGCSNDASTEPAVETPTASETPSAVPTPDETVSAEAEETTEPSREPSVEPTPEAPEAEVPAPEPLPTAPGDPFVPPPHGEPNPYAPGSEFVPPPHGEPNPYAGSPQQGPQQNQTFHPQPGWPGPSIVITPGTFTISGTGYSPGERIEVGLGKPRTDQQLLNNSTVYAGPDGSYTFNISVAPELAGAEYSLLTWAPDRGGWDAEASKRFLSVTVTSGS